MNTGRRKLSNRFIRDRGYGPRRQPVKVFINRDDGGSGTTGEATWGSITGTLTAQTDLQTALDTKANASHTHVKADITDFAHTHVSTDVTDFNEAVDDRVSSLLVGGTNVTLTYDDVANTLTVAAASTASVSWGGITGTLSNQTDLNTALAGKAGLTTANAFTNNQTITGVGAEPLRVKSGGTDHVYIGMYARDADPSTRSGFIGYGGAATTAFSISNTLGSINFVSAGSTIASASASGFNVVTGNLTQGGTQVSLVGHTHTIADVTGLQTALDGKQPSGSYAAASHTHVKADITDFAHTHVSADITDLTETIDDRVNGLLVAGSNITLTYDDVANTLTVAAAGGGSGLADGDYGDVVVSGGATTFTVQSADAGFAARGNITAGISGGAEGIFVSYTTSAAAALYLDKSGVSSSFTWDGSLARINIPAGGSFQVRSDSHSYRNNDGTLVFAELGSSGFLVRSGVLGYGSGSGGTVTQLTSKSTGVTLNARCGRITTHGAALAANTSVSFMLTNSDIASTDNVLVNIQGGATTNTYMVTVDQINSGSCRIHLRNISATSRSDTITLVFTVLKGTIS